MASSSLLEVFDGFILVLLFVVGAAFPIIDAFKLDLTGLTFVDFVFLWAALAIF